MLQKVALGVRDHFVIIGVANLVAALVIGRTMPANCAAGFSLDRVPRVLPS